MKPSLRFVRCAEQKISEALHTKSNETTETEYISPLPQTGFEQAEGFSPQIQNEMPELEINQPPIPYIAPAEQPIDKKKAFKIVKIVAACVIGAVIIAGIAINVTAAVSGNSKSIFGNNSISDWVNRPEMYDGDYSTYN